MIRPGVKTTEFWSGAAVSGALLVLAFDEAAPSIVRFAAAFSAAIASVGYARARSRSKRQTLKDPNGRSIREGN